LERSRGCESEAGGRPALDQLHWKAKSCRNSLRPIESGQALGANHVISAAGASPHQLASRSGQVRAVSGLTVLVRRNDQTLFLVQSSTNAPQEILLLRIRSKYPARSQNQVMVR